MSSSDVKEVKIEELRRALAECEAEHGPRHVKTAQAALTLAIYRQHDHPEGFAEAESLALRAADIYESVGDAYRRCLAGPFRILASIRQQQENLVEAESLLRRAIEVSQEEGEDKVSGEDELQTLGYLLLKQGRYIEATEFFERALHVVERDNGPDDRHLGRYLYSLAQAYLGLKRYDDAIELLRRDLDLEMRYDANDLDERADLLELIGDAETRARRHDLADECLREAQQLRAQADAKLIADLADRPDVDKYDAHYQEMDNLIDQADVLALRNDFAGAIALIEKVVDYRGGRSPAGPAALTSLLTKLAKWRSKLGQHAAAEALLNQSLSYLESKALPLDELRQKLIEQRSSPNWRPGSRNKSVEAYYWESLATVLNDLGVVYHAQERSEAAVASYQQAVTIWKVTHEKVPGFVSTGLLNLGTHLCQQGDLRKGCEFIEEALAWERGVRADSSFVATLSTNLAHFRQQQGQLEEAVSLWLSAVELWIKNEGACQPAVLQALNAAGRSLTTLQQWSRARTCFLQALGVAREAAWCTSQPIVGLLINLSDVAFPQRQFQQVVPYMREALTLCESDPEALSDEHLVVLRYLTESLVMTDQYEEAESVGLRWLAMLKRCTTPDYPALPVALANLARTYHELHRGTQALPLIEQAIPLVENLDGPDKRAAANYYRIKAEILQGLNRFAAAKAAIARAKQLDRN